MKKIMTICLATFLLPSFSILNAQALYSETFKQASFIRPETVTENFVLGYAGTFTGFDVKKINTGVQLVWKVSDWELLSHFDIQKSTNGKQFTTIGSLGANAKDQYRFVDRGAVTEPVYFRIKSVGRDGTVFYSSVVSPGTEVGNILIAYPMPAQSEVTVQHALVVNKGFISVLTQEGNLVMTEPLSVGTVQTALDLSYLKPGVYLLRFDTGNGKAETTRIVKQ